MRSDQQILPTDPNDSLLPFGAPEAPGRNPADAAGRPPSSMPYTKHRRRRTKRALRPLLYSLPVVVVFLAVAAFLIGLPVWSSLSLKHWIAGEIDEAESDYLAQADVTSSGPETWVAHYNLGTTRLDQHLLDEGVSLLRTAWDEVPKADEIEEGLIETYSYECQVRINLSLGIEAQGDELAAALDWDGALTAYDEAKEIVSPCRTAEQNQQNQQSQNQPGGEDDEQQDSGEQADESADRLEEKADQAEENSSGASSESDGDSQGRGGRSDESQNGSSGDEQQNGSSGDQQQNGSSGDEQQNGSSGGDSEEQKDESGSNGFEGESEAERERREQLEKKLQQGSEESNDQYDKSRAGNPNGAW